MNHNCKLLLLILIGVLYGFSNNVYDQVDHFHNKTKLTPPGYNRGGISPDTPDIQPKLLKNLELENKILDEKTWKKDCDWALSKIKNKTHVALVIRREFLD